MFKLLVLASLVALSVAAPAEVVSKSAHSETVENKNDPYNPYDDTVVKKSSVHETVKTDNRVVAVDKTTAAVGVPAVVPAVAGVYPYSLGFYPYSPFYTGANVVNPDAYYPGYYNFPYFNPANPLSPLNPNAPAFSGYTPYNPYTPVPVNNYKSYYGY